MRGRVGRGNRKAFCYLLAPPLGVLPDDARRRLQAVANFSDLGSGLHIAMQDLDIRGAGNMLGAEQSGFIADLGYETYQKVLAEAMEELREDEQREEREQGEHSEDGERSATHRKGIPAHQFEHLSSMSSVLSVLIETDIPAFFPESYVPSNGERISLYRELDSFTHQRQLNDYRTRLIDRFGTPPTEAEELMRIIQLKWVASQLGFDRLILKQQRMIGYLPPNNDSPYYQTPAFSSLIHYASWHPRDCQLRDGDKRSIIVRNVTTIEQALAILTEILKEQN
jgi:transcription-repair coupling factor (superfamily II helicase)